MAALRHRATLGLVVGALGLVFTVAAHAQTVTGSIYGRVIDSSGGAVPGATIEVVNPDTGRVRTAVSNNLGQYTLTFLPPGRYDVRISLDGFKTHNEKGVRVSAGQPLNLRTTLEVGTIAEMVTVESVAPLLNSTSAEQNVQLDDNMVAELPMNRRSITQLLSLGPGLDASGSNIAINGLAPESFTFSLDGVDAQPDPEINSLSQTGNFNFIKGVSVEAVKEVEISKNIFSAEIGMTMSGNVNIITKGGTNIWHGSGFFNIQRGDWNAGDPITDFKEPERYEAFGASLGGPIVKDKLFFFGVYEGYRQEQDETVNDFVPTREFKDRVIAAIPESAAYWNLWEDPTEPPENPGDIEARLITTHFLTRSDNHFVGRLDYNFSDTAFANVRYIRGRPDLVNPRTAIGNTRQFLGFNDNVQANLTKIHSSNLTSEWRFGWGRAGADRTDLLWKAQALTIAVPGVDDTDGEQLARDGGNWSAGTVWSWLTGRHSVKFGGMFRHFRVERFNEEMPVWEFASVEDLLANRAEFVAFQLQLNNFQLTSFDYGFFVQDDFRVNPDLMLNLGLRWDYSAVPNERDGRIWNRDGKLGGLDEGREIPLYRPADSIWDANYNLWSPRVGFAWSIDEKTVLRGGAGIFYIPFNMFSGPVEVVSNSENATPGEVPRPVEVEFNAPQLEALGIRYPTFNNEVANFIGATERSGDSSIVNQRPNPRSYQWTLGISRQLTETLAWDVAYVGNNGRKITTSERINRPDRFTAEFPVAGVSSPRYYHQVDETNYHALQTSLRRRFQDGFSFGAHYTYSSNTGLFANSLGCCDREWNSQIEGDYSRNHSYVTTHVRHRLWADILYELPFGDGPVAEGWLIGAVFQARSGSPIEVRDRGGSGYRWSRPDYLGESPSSAVIDSSLDETNWQYLDPNLFARVPRTDANIQERPGTSARAPYIGPGRYSLDLSLSKNFRWGDDARVQFRVDLFNATNHANRDNPRRRMDQSRFGQINDIDGRRTLQLGVRLDF